MSWLIKWKNSIYLIVFVITISFSAYGIHNIIFAFNDTDNGDLSDISFNKTSTNFKWDNSSYGNSCNPGGCTVCAGCVRSGYEQNIQTFPSESLQIEKN